MCDAVSLSVCVCVCVWLGKPFRPVVCMCVSTVCVSVHVSEYVSKCS